MSSSSPTTSKDLDMFLTSIESKLRTPFSSLDLNKIISTSDLTYTITPTTFLRNTLQSFDRMAKPIKLRVIVTLLCMDPYQDEGGIVDVLEKAMSDEDEWVRILAGIVKGKLFVETEVVDNDDDDDDNNNERDPQRRPIRRSCRSKEATKILEKTADGILKECLAHAQRAEKDVRNADDDSSPDNDDKNSDGEIDEEEEGRVTSAAAEFLQDRAPLYIPLKFRLLDGDVVRDLMPECFVNRHFAVEASADILEVDKRVEAKKAQEEANELEMRGEVATTTAATTSGTGGPSSSSSSSAAASKTTTAKSSSSSRPSSTFLRPATRPLPSTTLLSRHAGGRFGGRSHTNVAGGGRVVGRSRAGGVTSLATPKPRGVGTMMGRRTMMERGRTMKQSAKAKVRLMGRSSNEDGGDGEDDDGGGEDSDDGEDAVGRSWDMPMDPLDDGDRRGGGKATNSRMDARKRIYEKAMASGLRKGAQPAGAPGHKRGRMMTNAAAAGGVRRGSGGGLAPGGRGMASRPGAGGVNRQTSASSSPSSQPPGGGTATNNNDWHQLLEQSNKVTPEDRTRVEQFFTRQFNPTPDVMVYKMKLNEEKKIQPDGTAVKETLYLELDYNSFGVKKLRKIKKY